MWVCCAGVGGTAAESDDSSVTRSEPSPPGAEASAVARLAVTCAFAAATTPPLPAPPGLAPPEPPASLLAADQHEPRHHTAVLPRPGRGAELDIDAAARGDGLNMSLSAPQLGEREDGGGSDARQRSVGGAPSGTKPQV